MDFPEELESGYRPIEMIGKGGFARVFRVRSARLGREVALKLMGPFDSKDPELFKRCRREIETLSKLSHPGLIAVHEVGSAAGHLYYTMDLVHGTSLAHQLGENGVLTLARLTALGEQVAETLFYLHGQGVVHRDIKPDNILMDEDRGPILADLGLAHVEEVTAMTAASAIIGTPSYLTPEQITGGPATPATDIYQLGVVLFRAATGQVPFSNKNFTSLCEEITERPPPRPTALVRRLPPALDEIVLRCLAKRPRDRYASAQDLAKALSLLRGDTSRPQPPAKMTAGIRLGARTRPIEAEEIRLPGPGRRFALSAAGASAILLAAGVAFLAVRSAPGITLQSTLCGQRTIVARLSSAPDRPGLTLQATVKGTVVPGRPRGDAIVFDELTPDTEYRLEWRPDRGSSTVRSLRTLPDLRAVVKLEIVTGPSDALEVQLRADDARLADTRMAVLLGDTALERLDTDRFRCPLPGSGEPSMLRVWLPDVRETVDFAVMLAPGEKLLQELTFIERELERHLARIRAPAWISGRALAAGPIERFAPRRGSLSFPLLLLDRLRRIGPAVRATVANPGVPGRLRWGLVHAVTRLVAAEALAAELGQPPLGLMQWAAPLFRVERRSQCAEVGTPMLQLLKSTVRLGDPRFSRQGIGAALEVVGGTDDTRATEELSLSAPVSSGVSWFRVKICAHATSTAAAPVIELPGTDAAVEVPLILHRDPEDRSRRSEKDVLTPRVLVDLYFRLEPGPARVRPLTLKPTYRPDSTRVNPVYMYAVEVPVPGAPGPR
ncbi:MAG: serine/threonine protein kinase [Candidatus Riflebacteria bacterium]|nr:serine/threonine protein kinase [Candidatus Riflebacteria bacterium]